MAEAGNARPNHRGFPVASSPIEPSAVIIPCSLVSLANARPLGSHARTWVRRHAPAGRVARRLHPGSNGLRTQWTPQWRRRAKQGSEHPGKSVNMFMGVDVADSETAGLDALYLGDGLGLNLLLADAAAHQVTQKFPTVVRNDEESHGSSSDGTSAGRRRGEPSTSTTWQPTARAGCAKAI